MLKRRRRVMLPFGCSRGTGVEVSRPFFVRFDVTKRVHDSKQRRVHPDGRVLVSRCHDVRSRRARIHNPDATLLRIVGQSG